MKLKPIYKHHYHQLASDNHRAKVCKANYWPLILFFTAFILAGYNF